MNILFRQILNNKEASALPGLRESGGLPALISGLSAVHRANLAAALAEAPEEKLFVICPDDTAAENFAVDLRAMLGEEVPVLGMREFTFYPTEAASRQAEQSRIAVLYSLAKENARIHVASVPGLLQRTIPPEVLLRAAFEIRSDSTCLPEDLEDALVRCGYSRAEQVDGPGQFARRGGILDFFSPFSSDPVRIEFWGDEIDSMSSFDVLTQRRTDPLESCTVLPAAEVLPTLSAGGVEVLAREMDAAASRLAKRRTSENAAALAANMRADAERLRNGVLLSDADRYLPVIYPMASGLDYVSPDALVFLDQPARCGERARDYIKRLADDIRELGRRALVPASEENFYLSFEAMLKRLKDFPLYMADAFTAGRTPIEPRTMMSIPAKQLPSYAGNAQTAADDARQLLKAGSSLAVLAGDKRRAEVLCSFLNEHGVPSLLSPDDQTLPVKDRCTVYIGAVSAGMEYPGLHLAILTDAQLIRKKGKAPSKRKLPAGRQRLMP